MGAKHVAKLCVLPWLLCRERWKYDVLTTASLWHIQPSPFYDYDVIYLHTKHIFRRRQKRNFFDYNCMIIILWEQFCLFVLAKRINFVKMRARDDEKKNERWKMSAGKEINVNFLNILSSFANVEYMKRKEKCCNNPAKRGNIYFPRSQGMELSLSEGKI